MLRQNDADSRRSPRPSTLPQPSAARAGLAIALGAACLAACMATPRTVPWQPLPEPPRDSVDTVAFLVGDAGYARPGASPVLTRLGEAVESWSRRLARDSAVAIFFLGDNVYPDGVHPRSHPDFALDSLHIEAQVRVVEGPFARRHHTPAWFLGGNHDWGSRPGEEGLARLREQEELLEAIRDERGTPVALAPPTGEPGPVAVDLGRRARFLLLDTHWWLQAGDDPRTRGIFEELAEGLHSAGGRNAVIAAHHPFVSGGSHGGPISFWRGLGFGWLLRKTGSLVQDLNSVPYREFTTEMRRTFRAVGRPLLFAGGHDHSLQVIRGTADDHPLWSVVSGSASQLTETGKIPGMRFGRGLPGFVRLTFLADGSVQLHVVAGSEDAVLCPAEGQRTRSCMERSLDSFEVVYAVCLRGPRP